MHAGGTSAVATSLAQAGASLGVAATPTVDEDAGATACARLTALSDEAMRRMGIAWDSPVALPDRWERSDALKALTPLAIAAVAQEYPAGKAAVVAEPRMCRLLPFWREAFESNGFAVSAALALRRPYEVANALAKRAQFAPEKSLALWHHHLVEGERGSRGLRRAVFTLDQWQADPAATLARIAADANYPLAASAEAQEAARTIMQRRKSANGDDRARGSLQSGLDTILEAGFAKLAKLGPGVDPRRDIEALATSARPALTAAIAPWIAAELDAARDVSVRLATELAAAQQMLEAAAAEVTALRDRSSPDATLLAAQLDALREDRQRERSMLIDELTKTRGEIVRLTTVVAEAPRATETMRTELAQAHRDLYDERATITRLTEEVEKSRREADGNAQRFLSAHHHLETLANELAQTRESAQSHERDYVMIADEIDAWRVQFSDMQSERDKLLTERDHAMRQLTRLTAELEAARHERDAATAERESLNQAMHQSGQALNVLREELPRRAAAEASLSRERDGLVTSLRAAQEKIAALESLVGERSAYIGELVQRHNALAARLNDLDKRALVRAATWLGGPAKPRM